MAANRITHADLRASDAERDAVAAELAEHHQDGRLDATEFDERVGRAISARTRGDLDGLLADLPRRAPEQPPVPRRALWPFPVAAVAFVAVFVALVASAGRGPDGPHHASALWMLWWLIPIAIFTARRLLRGGRPRSSRPPAQRPPAPGPQPGSPQPQR
jgi:hypothetical protein